MRTKNTRTRDGVAIYVAAILLAPIWIPMVIACVLMTPRRIRFREVMA